MDLFAGGGLLWHGAVRVVGSCGLGDFRAFCWLRAAGILGI